jgi:L-alanine-DL-glutamate epimerase-like enolase superfamily enzyme
MPPSRSVGEHRFRDVQPCTPWADSSGVIEIMLDCFMGGDATRAIRLCERITEFYPRCVEEPVPADRIGDFAPIRRATRVPVATGPARVQALGLSRAAQSGGDRGLAIQPGTGVAASATWLGFCTLAFAYGRQVFPHEHSIYPALQVIAAQSPAVCPMAQFLLRPQAAKQAVHAIRTGRRADPLPCCRHRDQGSCSTRHVSTRSAT